MSKKSRLAHYVVEVYGPTWIELQQVPTLKKIAVRVHRTTAAEWNGAQWRERLHPCMVRAHVVNAHSANEALALCLDHLAGEAGAHMGVRMTTITERG